MSTAPVLTGAGPLEPVLVHLAPRSTTPQTLPWVNIKTLLNAVCTPGNRLLESNPWVKVQHRKVNGAPGL